MITRNKLLLLLLISISLWMFSVSPPPNKQDENTNVVDNSQISTTTNEKIVIKQIITPINHATSSKKIIEKTAVKPSEKTSPNTNTAKQILPSPPTEIKPAEPQPDFEAINQFARKAVVNILCTSNSIGISGTSGTGVLIDSRGIILTNAHLGQYWLLKDYPSKDSIECVIRTGSPAYPRYKAELMYIPPSWVEGNPNAVREQKGTGEKDFAFLRITGSIDGSPLPPSFDYTPIDRSGDITKNEIVVLVSYPAGFLGGQTILQSLNMTSAFTSIQDFFTFKEGTIDLISVGGTVISQKGASGGAVIDGKSSLIGIITTSTNATTTSARQLNAITLSYINRILWEEAGEGLAELLSQDSSVVAKTFNDTVAGTLTKILTDVLNK